MYVFTIVDFVDNLIELDLEYIYIQMYLNWALPIETNYFIFVDFFLDLNHWMVHASYLWCFS